LDNNDNLINESAALMGQESSRLHGSERQDPDYYMNWLSGADNHDIPEMLALERKVWLNNEEGEKDNMDMTNVTVIEKMTPTSYAEEDFLNNCRPPFPPKEFFEEVKLPRNLTMITPSGFKD
jgi:hypothetical protein